LICTPLDSAIPLANKSGFFLCFTKFIKAMKKLCYLLMLAAVMLTGCAKDPMNEETIDLKERKAEKRIPKICWLSTIPNYSLGTILCMPEELGAEMIAGGWMQGHESYGGKLRSEECPWVVNSCELNYKTMVVTFFSEGMHTLANRDYYFFNAENTLNLADGSMVCQVSCYGGVGRYENATAEITLTGSYNFETNVATFSGRGYWVFSE